ncbi:15-hydroxyprostaglandin dehydrogenase [Elysia marginata]|uniref:15-hydroxyprostaglandin dehydrogenase n=1 Tax=Elysia marginata TaxID=1093978 RepID=A0AAV4GYF3_9GAST|nr:15-hydroxyprostaglandin dehydrogenase [Elysia marginata]
MRKDKGGKGGRIINTAPASGLQNCYPVPVYCGVSNAIRAFSSSMSEQPNCADLGLEFGTISSNHAATEIVSTLNGDKVHFMSSMRAKLAQETLGIERVVDAFLDLVTLEKMNGAVLFVSRHQKVFIEIKSLELGKNYPPTE